MNTRLCKLENVISDFDLFGGRLPRELEGLVDDLDDFFGDKLFKILFQVIV